MSRLIDADALIADMEKRYCKDCERRKGVKDGEVRMLYEIGEAPCRACGVGDAIDDIDSAPTIDAEPVRRGHWILPDVCYEDIECSVCHAYMPLPISFDYRPTYKYCPMCGAKMDEVSE